MMVHASQRLVGVRIELQNAMDLSDGLRVEGRAVTARCDKFAFGASEVTAPIRNNTVATIWSIPATSVTDNGVIGNSLGDRDRVDRHNETVVRRQRVFGAQL